MFFEGRNNNGGIQISQEKARLSLIAIKEEEKRLIAINLEKQRLEDEAKERERSLIVQNEEIETLEVINVRRDKLRMSISLLTQENKIALEIIQTKIQTDEEKRMEVLMTELQNPISPRAEDMVSPRSTNDSIEDLDESVFEEEGNDGNDGQYEELKDAVAEREEGAGDRRSSLEQGRAKTASMFLEIEELERQEEEAEKKKNEKKKTLQKSLRDTANCSGKTDSCSPESIDPIMSTMSRSDCDGVETKNRSNSFLGEWADSPLEEEGDSVRGVRRDSAVVEGSDVRKGVSFADVLNRGVGGVGAVGADGEDEEGDDDDDDDDEMDPRLLSLVPLLGPRLVANMLPSAVSVTARS